MKLDLPSSLNPTQRRAVEGVVKDLAAVPNLRAVVLGGSHCRGTADSKSDIDLGLYYFDATPFSIAAIREIAGRWSCSGTPVVAGFYEWGPWVNGGAWIDTAAGKIDLLFRSIELVESTIADAVAGTCHRHYDQQPAHGFYSVIYLAETEDCRVLSDPEGVIRRLKLTVRGYPHKLRESIIAQNLWAAEFSLHIALGFAANGDVYNVSACLNRVAAYLTQVLFALNQRYFRGDKGALQLIDEMATSPTRYTSRLTALLAHPGETVDQLSASVASLAAIWEEVVECAGPSYVPKYRLPAI